MVHQLETDLYYPESDGQPMGETDRHRQLLSDLVFALARWYAARADVYASGNLFIYYVFGDRDKVICPDVFVAFGSAKRRRRTYQTWRDGPFPLVVIELASASTRGHDLGAKRELYEREGVLEYYVFDPHADDEETEDEAPDGPVGDMTYYQRASRDEPWGVARPAALGAVVHSDLLGLGLIARGQKLRLLDEATGALLPTPDEEAAGRLREAEARRQEAAARRREAAARRQEAAAGRGGGAPASPAR